MFKLHQNTQNFVLSIKNLIDDFKYSINNNNFFGLQNAKIIPFSTFFGDNLLNFFT